MIVMQYRFTLPANYDMTIIEKRIEENGAKLNGFPGLLFKAWLVAKCGEGYSIENRYAPLYVWKNANAMTMFLQSPAFKKLTQDFGWPQIETWLALHLPCIDEIRSASWLSITKQNIPAHSDLSILPLDGHLSAWDISRWQLLQANFGDAPHPARENYRIGYMASEAW
ncbi:DUF4865 family protein [Pantoea cypripedii]|uniref:DUF4865 domain-containing protein n=1 Tax=Pantoea cypripedii TaxID=55209 RepID=A0A1X1ELU9_PANCY|nr:DUF4865 family protein [Pantoea cypripedii]MBP2200217.1 hypothetical protein [Pantoea cypripedii]ORM89812.1 hypothetical protein HA50_24755 [Pantoea cypripedii]